jgi:hypothetical protein
MQFRSLPMLSAFFLPALLGAGPALSATLSPVPPVLSPGFYAGPGDGVTTVLRVLPNRTAILGSIPQGSTVTPQAIRKNAAVQAGGFLGRLKSNGTNYVLTLSDPKQNLPLCRYLLKPANGKWQLSSEMAGCASYHGASWGYGGSFPGMGLKKVS